MTRHNTKVGPFFNLGEAAVIIFEVRTRIVCLFHLGIALYEYERFLSAFNADEGTSQGAPLRFP